MNKQELLANYFTQLEAREFSKLRKDDPVLVNLMRDRLQKRNRFEKLASVKIHRGEWQLHELPQRWHQSLARLYSVRGWRVQEGARGRQQAMPKGSPNPWAMYRDRVKDSPGPRWVSPWQIRQIRKGKTRLEMGIVFAQRAEKRGGISTMEVVRWIEQKEKAIARARGPRRKQLKIERDRLTRLLT